MQGYRHPEAVLDQLVQRAQRDLRWSRVFLYLGGVIGLLPGLLLLVASFISSTSSTSSTSSGQAGNSTAGLIILSLLSMVVGIAVFAYDLWANYWGWITIWRWYWLPRQGDTGALLAMLALIVLTGGAALLLISIVAGTYGVFGGGIYQYLKAKKVIAAGIAHGILNYT